MTTPIPLIIFQWLILGPLQFVGVLAVGFFIWRWVAPQATKTWAVIATPFLGGAVASVWLILAQLVLGWDAAVWILFGLGIIALFCLKRASQGLGEDLWWPTVRRFGPWILIAALALSFTSGSFVEHGHFASATMMGNGAFPLQNPFLPTVHLTYHYGFEILVGAANRAGFPVPFASDIWQGLLQAALVIGIWVWFRTVGIAPRRAVVGTLLVSFVGTLGYLVRPFRSLAPDALGTIFPFHNTFIAHPLYLTTFTKSTLVALGIVVVALALYHARLSLDRKRVLWILPVLLAATALSNEVIFVLILPFVFLGVLLESWSKGFRVLVIMAGFAGLILAVLSGGLVQDLVKGFFQGGAAERVTSLVWDPALTIPTFFASPIRLGTPFGIFRFLLEYGARFFLAFFALKSFRGQSVLVRTLLVASVIIFFIPFFFAYPSSPPDFFRIWIPAFLILAFYGSREMLAKLVKVPWWQYLAVPALIFGGLGSTLLTNIPQLGIYWAGMAGPGVESTSLWPGLLDPASRLSPGSTIGTNILITRKTLFTLYQMPQVFGVPINTCFNYIWDNEFGKDSVCKTFSERPAEDTLRALGVTHLVLTPDFVAAHSEEDWFKKNLILLRRFDPPAWARRLPRSWWEGREVSYLLYRVEARR